MAVNSNEKDASARTKQERPELLTSKNRFRALLDINNAIISILNKQDLFHAIAKTLKENFPVDCTAVTLYNEKKDVFEVLSIEPFSSSVELYSGFEMPHKDSHSGWTFDHNRPLIAKDIAKEQKFATDQVLLTQGLRSYIVLPLETTNKVIGTFNIGNASPNKFKESDIEFTSLVAKQLALAIDNAQKHEEIRKLKERLEKENVYLQEEIKNYYNFGEIIGSSAAMQAVFKNIEKVAVTDATVLLTGETGTGKELIARAIHNSSNRKDRVMVTVNCGALPAGLVESELFGHEKGAFTGATAAKKGRFELADRGTIFLDEVGELPLETQIKLLRVLQEQEFEHVGGTQTKKVDARVIAATNRNLEEAVKLGAFRVDLFYRLNVFPIHIPRLGKRLDDIPLLADYFVKKFSRRIGKRIDKISPEALEALIKYDWPGNVRELANLFERAVILAEGKTLQIEHIGISNQSPTNEKEASTLESVERNHILSVLGETGWKIQGKLGAAARLDLNPGTLRSRMKKLGITRPQSPI